MGEQQTTQPVRRRPIEDAQAMLEQRLRDAWPDHLNRCELNALWTVLSAAAVILVAVVAFSQLARTMENSVATTIGASLFVCIAGPGIHRLLASRWPVRAIRSTMKLWAQDCCRANGVSPIEGEQPLYEFGMKVAKRLVEEPPRMGPAVLDPELIDVVRDRDAPRQTGVSGRSTDSP